MILILKKPIRVENILNQDYLMGKKMVINYKMLIKIIVSELKKCKTSKTK